MDLPLGMNYMKMEPLEVEQGERHALQQIR